MTARETPEDALAAALHRMGQDSDRARDWCNSWATGALHQQIHDDDAAAILAALDGWTLVPASSATMALDHANEEIARLEKGESECSGYYIGRGLCGCTCHQARAALAGGSDDNKEGETQ